MIGVQKVNPPRLVFLPQVLDKVLVERQKSDFFKENSLKDFAEFKNLRSYRENFSVRKIYKLTRDKKT